MKSAQSVAVMMMIVVVCVSAAPLPRSRRNETSAATFHRLMDKDKNPSRRTEPANLGDATLESNTTNNTVTKATHGKRDDTLNRTNDTMEEAIDVPMNNATLDATEDTINVTINRKTYDATNRTTFDAESDARNDTAKGSMFDTANGTLYDRTDELTNDTVAGSNMTVITPFIFILPVETTKSFEDHYSVSIHCVLPTCLTANLGSSLQKGDEKAGGATTDPFGVGKK